jgi:hypothetical protein
MRHWKNGEYPGHTIEIYKHEARIIYAEEDTNSVLSIK